MTNPLSEQTANHRLAVERLALWIGTARVFRFSL